MQEPSPATLELHYPVSPAGETVTRLVMRPPRARDSRDAQRGAGSPGEMEIRLFANLCEVAPAVIEDLHMADYQRLQEVYQNFLVVGGAAA